MKEDKVKLLISYIKINIVPILEDFIFGKDIPDSVIIDASDTTIDLNGHYEGTKYMPPRWYLELTTSDNPKILVIDKIDSIKKEEQSKFIELLESRKISTFELPKNCVIVVTANEINKDVINERVYSLVAHIW